MNFLEITICSEIPEKLQGEGKIKMKNGSTATIKLS